MTFASIHASLVPSESLFFLHKETRALRTGEGLVHCLHMRQKVTLGHGQDIFVIFKGQDEL